jgi:hypothetical protein
MPKANLWNKSVSRVEYDHRAREARLRFEQIERLLVNRCCGAIPVFRGASPAGCQHRRQRPQARPTHRVAERSAALSYADTSAGLLNARRPPAFDRAEPARWVRPPPRPERVASWSEIRDDSPGLRRQMQSLKEMAQQGSSRTGSASLVDRPRRTFDGHQRARNRHRRLQCADRGRRRAPSDRGTGCFLPRRVIIT